MKDAILHFALTALPAAVIPSRENPRNIVRCDAKKTDQYRTFVRKWLAGEVDGTTTSLDVPSHHIRRYLIEKNGECCQLCGWAERNPHTGRIPVHLDHIDGNARNNTEKNLRYLCPNHHALTGTFGNCNKGNGRPGRRARYLKAQGAGRGSYAKKSTLPPSASSLMRPTGDTGVTLERGR